MLASLAFAAALTFSTPLESDCAAAARIECRELMGLVFRSADTDTGRAMRLFDGQRWSVTPIAIARIGNRRALVTANASEAAGHVQTGSWSLYIFDDSAPHLQRAYLDFQRSGSFGNPGSGTLILLDDNTPALVVEGGGSWQGHSCSWTSVDVIGADGPRPLIAPVLTDFHAGGEPRSPDVTGHWSQLSLTAATLDYDDGALITFAPGRDGLLRATTPAPQRC